MSDMSDASMPFDEEEPTLSRTGELADDRDIRGLVRRYERSFVDIDQRLKDILFLLGEMRSEMRTERDRTDQLERDFVEHRKYVDELSARRVRAAKRK